MTTWVDDETGGSGSTVVDIDSGTIDGAVIGGSNPAAGTFTTLTSTGALAVTGATTLTGSLAANGGITTTTLTASGQFLSASGTVSAPGVAIGEVNTGFFRNSVGAVHYTSAGIALVGLSQSGTGTVKLRSDGSFAWSSTSDVADTGDLMLSRDDANVLALKNGTNPQSFRLYSTTTGPVFFNMVWSGGSMFMQTSGSESIILRSLGTGSIVFGTNSINRWSIDGTNGNLVGPAGTTAAAPLRIPHGVAPTSPVNGDVWTTTAGIFVRVNGSTVGPLLA